MLKWKQGEKTRSLKNNSQNPSQFSGSSLRHSSAFIVSVLLLTVGAGCGKKQSLLSSKCQVSSDQVNSMLAKSEQGSFTVYLDKTFLQLSSETIQKIYTMYDTWNKQAQSLGRGSFFNVVETDIPAEVKSFSGDICSSPVNLGSENSFYVVRTEDAVQWSALGLSSNPSSPVQATTLQCSSEQRIRRQLILVNTQVTNEVQVPSVFGHEHGHSLGLRHSCASGASGDTSMPGYSSCSGLAVNHPYRMALMFYKLAAQDPLTNTGLPEVKEDLRENDKMRTECLYGQ